MSVSAVSSSGPQGRFPQEGSSMSVHAPNVYIVDTDPDVESRRALAHTVSCAGYQPVFHGSAAELLLREDPATRGCVVLDATVAEHSELPLERFLKACRWPTIVLAEGATVEMAVRTLRAGAINVLARPVGESELIAAIDEAIRLDARRHNGLQHLDKLRAKHAGLTAREREVLQLVLRGRLNKQIAADLGVVEKTIKVHRARVMRKLGARTVPELVAIATTLGVFVYSPLDVAMESMRRASGAQADVRPSMFEGQK
jgi:FixJ family two-component response regulator